RQIDRDYGAWALSNIIAHESAHHVQHLLYVKHPTWAYPTLNKDTELQADCGAGTFDAWLARKYTDYDIDPALEAAFAAGDEPSTTGVQSHGTGYERQSSTLEGYTTPASSALKACGLPTRMR